MCSIGESGAHQRPNWDYLPRKNVRPLPPALDPRMVHVCFITSTTGRSPLHVDCWSTWKYNHVGHLGRLISGTAVTAGGNPHIWIVHVKVSVKVFDWWKESLPDLRLQIITVLHACINCPSLGSASLRMLIARNFQIYTHKLHWNQTLKKSNCEKK